MRKYMAWEVEQFNRYPDDAAAVPTTLATPSWGWAGLVTG
jgi:hypothetical protein